VQVVLDKQNGILSVLRMSGMRNPAFWLATLLSDLVLFFVVVSIVLGMGLAFGRAPFIKVIVTCFVRLVCFSMFCEALFCRIVSQLYILYRMLKCFKICLFLSFVVLKNKF